MATERDVKIKQSVWREALEIYSDTKLKLEREKIKEKENMSTKTTYWQGQAANEYKKTMMEQFMEMGCYPEVQERIWRMCSILEDNDPQISLLLARCEGFLDNVNQNSYVEPIVSSDIINGGLLLASYDKISEMMTTCEDICSEAKSLQNSINCVMDSCSSFVASAGACQEQVDEAYLKLHRVDNFRQSMDLYVSGLQSLEENINISLRALAYEEERWGVAYFIDGGLTSEAEIEEIYRLLKEFGHTDEDILSIDLKSYTETDIVFLNQLLAGNYEELFLNDPSQLSYGCKRILTTYANSLLYTDYPEYNTDELNKFINALLKTNTVSPMRHRDYLGILKGASKLTITETMELTSAGLNNDMDKAYLDSVEELWKSQLLMQGLWSMLDQIDRRKNDYMAHLPNNYIDGAYYLKIENLEVLKGLTDNEPTIKFGVAALNAENEPVVFLENAQGVKEVTVGVTMNPEAATGKMQLNKLEMVYDEYQLNNLETTAKLCLSSVDLILKITGVGGFASATDLLSPQNSDLVDEGIGILADMGGPLYDYYKNWADYQKKCDEIGATCMVSQMGACIFGQIIDEDVADSFVFDYGIYDPQMIACLNEWSEKGLKGLLRKEPNQPIDQIIDGIGYKNEDGTLKDTFKTACESYDLDAAKVEECLDIMIKGNGDKDTKLYDFDPIVITYAANLLSTIDGHFCWEYINANTLDEELIVQ